MIAIMSRLEGWLDENLLAQKDAVLQRLPGVIGLTELLPGHGLQDNHSELYQSL